MDSFVIAWLLSGLSVVALIACVDYNRRTGFRKWRTMESPAEGGLLWSGAIPAARTRLEEIAVAEASTRQLISLYQGYSASSEPVQIPADVQGEYAITVK